MAGRDSELAAIRELLSTVRDGLSATLVVRGAAGIGKTALLDACVQDAGDLDVVRVVGIESEMELGFAGLHQIIGPYLAGMDGLPAPQARGLRAAFGMSDDAPDRFLVGLASLTLLSEAAVERGLLIVIDDAQWLDRESAGVIAFVARRLFADRVGVLISVREPTARELPFQTLKSLTVHELSAEEAARVVASAAASPIADTVLARLVADAEGNPLALVELPRELTAEQLAGSAMLPETIPVGTPVEVRFLRQVRALPLDAQRALLVAAADPTGDAELLWRCGPQLGFDEGALDPAVERQLVSTEPHIRFRHPLIRSAIYHGVSERERRKAHAALAEATNVEVDPDRRVWHRAVAMAVADESTAAELEAAAARASERGGCAAAAAFLTRAADLSPDPAARARRLLAAGEQELEAGALEHAKALLEQAEPGLGDGVDRVRAMVLECQVLMWQGSAGRQGQAGKGPAVLLDAARYLAELDVSSGRALLLEALLPAVFTLELAQDVGLAEIAREAFVMTLPEGSEPSCGDLLLDGLAGWIIGDYATAAPLLRTAISILVSDDPASTVVRWMGYGCWAAYALGDTTHDKWLCNRFYELAREAGAWTTVQEALHYRKLADITHGALQSAHSYVAEAREIELARGAARAIESCVTQAWFAEGDDFRELLQEMRADAGSDAGFALMEADYSEALFELGTGGYQQALKVWPDSWDWDIYTGTFGIADLVESALRSDDRPRAEAATARYAPRAEASGCPAPLGLLARAQALLAPDDSAEELYNKSDDIFAGFYRETMERTSEYEAKRVVLRGTTTEVIDEIPDGSLDFAYVDGDHTLRGITIDLVSVFPKIREGGWIGGDDFSPSIWQHSA